MHESHPANIKADTLVVVLPDYRLPLGRSHEESDILRPGPAAGQHLVRPDLTFAEGTPASVAVQADRLTCGNVDHLSGTCVVHDGEPQLAAPGFLNYRRRHWSTGIDTVSFTMPPKPLAVVLAAPNSPSWAASDRSR